MSILNKFHSFLFSDGWGTAILSDEAAALETWSLETLSDDNAANCLI